MEASVWLVLLLALCCSAAPADIPVRLVDGSKSSEGRVEIFFNNTWWTVCPWGYYSENAKVVCRQLGYSTGSNAGYTHVANFGLPPSYRPMLLELFTCSGTESNLDECRRRKPDTSQCTGLYFAEVVCASYVDPPMQVRLMDGRNLTDGVMGRVEVFIDGTWGTICDDGTEGSIAHIICHMLGYSSGSQYTLYRSRNETGTGPVLITRLWCQPSDMDLATCMWLNSSVNSCPTSQVIGVVCTYNIPVRLVDGYAPSEGRVEIFIRNTWWTVCWTSWKYEEAKVVCRQLGFSPGPEMTLIPADFLGKPPSYLPISRDWFSCRGSEFNISDCGYYPDYSDCGYDRAAVVCQPTVRPPMPVRLTDGQISTNGVEGRVEVLINGTWGTICDDPFRDYDSNAANVVCPMLGYTGGHHFTMSDSLIGTESGPILITRLLCQVSDRDLTTCLQLNSSVYACPTSKVISVVCNYTRSSEDIPVRLVGPSGYEGTVELFAYGRWRKLCFVLPELTLARVVCRQLGLNSSDLGVWFWGHHINEPRPASNAISRVFSCNGTEHNFGNCENYLPSGFQSCNPYFELGVSCHPGQVGATSQVISTTTKPEMTTHELSPETTEKETTTREVSPETTTETRVEKPETATEKSSGNLSSVGANKNELNVVEMILGATLALSLIVILVLVIFLIRERRRGAPYLEDDKRGRDSQEAGQGPTRQQLYQNPAFNSQTEAAVSPVLASAAPPPAEQDHHYERLQGRATRQM